MSALAELLRTPASIPGPASSPGIGLPRRTEIVDWSEAIDDLSRAAAEYRAAADKLECVADRHVQQLTAPGGSVWEGDAADAAVESSYADRGVVYRAADHMREMAKAANAGAQNLGNLRDRALDAISSAESDGFRVSDDLTVTDTRPYPNGSNFYAALQAEADEHHSYIAMWAGALASADDEVGTRLRTGAVALDSMIPADWRASDATWSTAVQAVDYTTRPEAPPTPSEPTDAFSVNDAGDVHRIVDLLPPGRHPGVKTLPNARAIEALYGHLTENSLPGPASTYPGQWRVLSDGTKIGLRQTSKFGGPTVEIWYPDGMKSDVHLSERPKGSQPSPVPAPAPAPAPVAVPEPKPAPTAVPDLPSSPSLGSQPIVTPEDGGVIGVIGGIGIGIAAGMLELGKLVFNP